MKLLIKTEFYRNIKSLLLWTAIVVSLSVMMLSLYPLFENSMGGLSEFLEMYPEGFLRAFGLGPGQLDITETYGWFGTEGYLFMVLIGGSYAAILGSSILAKEEDDKTIEFLLSKPLSRNRILVGKAIVVITNLIVMNLILGIGLGITFALLGDFRFITILLLITGAFILQMIFASLAFMISIFVVKSRKVMSISLGIVIGFYALDIVKNVTDKLDILKYFTPYEYVNAIMIINENKIDLVYLLITLGIILVSCFVSWKFYNSKDITV